MPVKTRPQQTSAQQVGNAKGYKKSISCNACPKNTGNEHIPNESQDAGYHRHSADGSEGFKQIHGSEYVNLNTARHLRQGEN